MDLDRQTIEKKDFPIGRRGYDPEAVDAHLEELALAVESLRRAQSAQPGESLASSAATQVQAIVEAAETTAADIRRQAELEARRSHQEAERASERTRDEAVQRAETHVEGVAKATALMLQRVDAMESEINALLESLRTGATRLTADLSLLQGNLGELYDAAGRKASGRGAAASGRAGAAEPVSGDDQDDAGGGSREGLVSPATPIGEPSSASAQGGLEADEALEPDSAAGSAPAGGSDLDGARLIALNMALNGQPREEADRYLAENFDIPDREALLDEVYAVVEG